MASRKTIKSGFLKYFISLVVLASVGMYFFIHHLNQKSIEALKAKHCMGIIKSMDNSKGSVTFHLNNDTISFGKIGTKISLVAHAGDSLIKHEGSELVMLIKADQPKEKQQTFQIF